jgi:tetratricopeptide (TPR) repeat protein
MLAGRIDSAQERFALAADLWDQLGVIANGSTVRGYRAIALARGGHAAEAIALAQAAAATGARDRETAIVCSCALALGLLESAPASAEEHARHAVRIAEPMQRPQLKGEAYECLGEALRAHGSLEEAKHALRHALRLYELKGNRPAAGTIERLLEGASLAT